MSYEFFEVFHIASIFLFFSTLSVSLLSPEVPKAIKIVCGISSLSILVAGLSLLLRLGLHGDGGIPGWIWGKISIWFLLVVGGPILAKRLKSFRMTAFFVLWGLLVVGISLAVYQP